MANKSMENIDGLALRNILAKRGLVMSEVSEALGFEKNYLSRAIGRGLIAKSASVSLKGLYGISPEEYRIPEPVLNVPEQLELPLVYPPGPIVLDVDYGKLKEAIEIAVYTAMKKIEGKL